MSPSPPSTGTTPRRWAWVVVAGLFFAAFMTAALVFLFVRRSGEAVLAGAMPHDVDIYVEVPRLGAAGDALGEATWVDGDRVDPLPSRDAVAALLAARSGLDASLVADALDRADALAVLVRLTTDSAKLAVVAHLDGPLGMAPEDTAALTSRGGLEGAERWGLAAPLPALPASPPASLEHALGRARFESLAWFAEAQLLVAGADELVSDIAEVLAGDAPSLETNEAFELARNQLPRQFGAFGFFDVRAVHRLDYLGGRELGDWLFAEPIPFAMAWNAVEAGSRATWTLPFEGDVLPPVSFDPSPSPLDLARRLPASTLAYATLATEVPGEGRDFLDALLAPMEQHEPKMAKSLRRELRGEIKRSSGIRLPNLLDAVGDQGAVGLLLDPGWKASAAPTFPRDLGIAVLQRVEDTSDARRVLRHIRQEAGLDEESRYRFEERDDGLGFLADPRDPTRHPFVEVRLIDGTAVAAIGPRPVAEEIFGAFEGKQAQLSGDAAHATAIASLGDDLRFIAWFDSSQLLRRSLSAHPGHGREAAAMGLDPASFSFDGDDRLTSAVGIGWRVEGPGWVVRVETLNLLPPLLPAVWINDRIATRTRVAAEAENTLRAIGRAAAASHARTIPEWRDGAGGDPVLEEVHRLCASATPVPLEVPRATTYQPSGRPGEDYDRGDETHGWRCLQFSRAAPQAFRFSYVAGGPYKGPARGGPDPGPDGFEVAAEADLDGDGRTSLFTLTGSPGPSGSMVVDRSVFSVDPRE